MKNYPICYTFRRCPYAMRARMILDYSEINVEYREIIFKNKPPHMLEISPKGTVPVLQLDDEIVLDESWDIMKWAVSINDPDSIFPESEEVRNNIEKLITINDFEFKENLDKYKYADRFPENTQEDYRNRCEIFLKQIDQKLNQSQYLFGNKLTLGDIGVFPFIRQFSMVEPEWLAKSEFRSLFKWLEQLLDSNRFKRIMDKKPLWQF